MLAPQILPSTALAPCPATSVASATIGLPSIRPTLPRAIPDIRTALTLLDRPHELFPEGARLAKEAGVGAFRMRIGYDRWVVLADASWQQRFAQLGADEVDPFEFRLRMPALHVPGARPPTDMVDSTRLSRESLARRCGPKPVAACTGALLDVIDTSLTELGSAGGELDDCFGFLLRCFVDMVSTALLGPELARRLPAGLSADYLSVERGLCTRALLAPWLPSAKGIRAGRAKQRIGRMWLDLVAARRRSGTRCDDILDDLLNGRLSDGTELALDDVEVAWMLNSIHWAAHRYPSVHAYWIGAQIHSDPSVLERVLAEQAGIETLDEESLSRMPYLRGCVMESLRLHPVMGLPRRLKRSIDICGHRIEAGEIVALSPFLAHHDASRIADAERFVPERWASDAPPVPRSNFIPGGLGRWGCVGMRLTVHMLMLLWAKILRSHRLEFSGELPEFRYGMIISPPTQPVPARLHAREATTR